MSDWTKWGGAHECPVNPESRVTVKFRDGGLVNAYAYTLSWVWGANASGWDIVEYKVMEG